MKAPTTILVLLCLFALPLFAQEEEEVEKFAPEVTAVDDDKAKKLLAGSALEGIVYRIGPTGDVFVLLDSPYREIKALEAAGAYAVEVEVIPAELLAEISKRTTLLTSSIGAGQ